MVCTIYRYYPLDIDSKLVLHTQSSVICFLFIYLTLHCGFTGLHDGSYFLKSNGRLVTESSDLGHVVEVIPRLRGGKGGFGSMLRAIGAQIEKTTNREACRDLSGRRLRDINEEQRLKKWISQQSDREKELEEKKKKKLEKLAQEPKHEFKDEAYDAERSDLSEKLADSVEQGFKASVDTAVKRKSSEAAPVVKKKKKKTIMDDDFSSSDDDGSDEQLQQPSTAISAR
ncbi:unnamed protein product [Nesidiocoris tenuis]|uniref:SDE2-like domain-containing protein n=1 Tax=Nesidiocoris tenuis TaxID=355587 RepID=A0A6H5HCN1_9HEMI|nr:unnamed protein product [Nesidiocoris tenuis]CAB0014622.1 unnamed protein product [Nesidiocoris tenuis]